MSNVETTSNIWIYVDDRQWTWWLETSELFPWSWLRVPEDLHDLHNDYPLAPERIKIRNVEKLFPNLNKKSNYVVHYENLKLYESLGLKITKIHRDIKFEESVWLEEYINLNTKLRIEAKKSGNNFEVEFLKIMNNSVFGKTLENITNGVDIRLISTDIVAQKTRSHAKLWLLYDLRWKPHFCSYEEDKVLL